MKKLFLLLAMAGIMVACGGNEEEKETKKSAFDYYVDYMEAAAEEDQEAYNKACEAYEEATKDMSREETTELYDKMNRWNYYNSDKASKATSNLIKMDREYEKSKQEAK